MILVSYLALFEIFRDFVQLVSITVQSLDFRVEVPMKFTFVNISDWISLEFASVTVSEKAVMGGQFGLLIFCTIYLIVLTVKEIRKKYQVQEIKAMTKFQKYFARGVILVITTIFAPLANSSLKFLSGKQSVQEGDEKNGIFLMSTITLVLLAVVIPIIFYYGIKNTRPELNTFDTSGGSNTDPREIYYHQLKKHNNPFKELYNLYSHKGAYCKLIVMLLKFAHMYLLLTDPSPEKSKVVFYGVYIVDIALNFGFFYYIFKLQPYHDYKSNRSSLLNFVNQISVIAFNIILLAVDSVKDNPNFTARLAISIVQLVGSVLIFCVYFLKTLFNSNKFIQNIFKMIFKELTFTSIKIRDINSFAGAKNRFLNYIYFNPQYYDKQKEIKINIWEKFWRNLIKTEEQLKSTKKVEDLLFTSSGNAPPYLLEFKDTVEERLEENTRIIQKIGEICYREELEKNKNDEYLQLKKDILEFIPPVDAYYEHPLLTSKNCFCKVSFFPFPFTCLLVYDDSSQILEVQGKDLKQFAESMKTQDYEDKREYRLKIRSLNGKTVKHDHQVKTTIWKQRDNGKGKKKLQRVEGTIYYTEGKFLVESEVQTIHTFPDGTKVDVGKGLKCSLYYEKGKGVDIDNEPFDGKALKLQHKDLEIDYSDRANGKLAKIIKENISDKLDDVNKIKEQFKEYTKNFIETNDRKTSVLSYEFNIDILNAQFDVFADKQKVQDLLSKEKNEKLTNLMYNSKDKFDNLYNQIYQFKKEDFNAYMYFVFNDIWTLNQDLPIIKRNKDILDPSLKDTCLIYQKDQSVNNWKELFIKRGLRTFKLGRGYFSDKLLRNLQKMINRFEDKPQNFICQEDIKGIQYDPVTKQWTECENIDCGYDEENSKEPETQYSQSPIGRPISQIQQIHIKSRFNQKEESISSTPRKYGDQSPTEVFGLIKHQSVFGTLQTENNTPLNKVDTIKTEQFDENC